MQIKETSTDLLRNIPGWMMKWFFVKLKKNYQDDLIVNISDACPFGLGEISDDSSSYASSSDSDSETEDKPSKLTT